MHFPLPLQLGKRGHAQKIINPVYTSSISDQFDEDAP